MAPNPAESGLNRPLNSICQIPGPVCVDFPLSNAQESDLVGYSAGRTLSSSEVSSPTGEAWSKSSPAHTLLVPSGDYVIDSFSQRQRDGDRLERGYFHQGSTMAKGQFGMLLSQDG